MRGGVSHHETPPRFTLKNKEICRRNIADNAVKICRFPPSNYSGYRRRIMSGFVVEI